MVALRSCAIIGAKCLSTNAGPIVFTREDLRQLSPVEIAQCPLGLDARLMQQSGRDDQAVDLGADPAGRLRDAVLVAEVDMSRMPRP